MATMANKKLKSWILRPVQSYYKWKNTQKTTPGSMRFKSPRHPYKTLVQEAWRDIWA